MKNKMNLLLVLAIAGAVFPAYAEKVGNGGVAVVCRDTDGKISSAELLDIFEGKNQMSLVYPTRDIGLDLEIDVAKTKMASNPNFLAKFQSEMATLKANLVFLPRGVGLEPTNDAFPVINKRGCKFENVANYSDDGKVYVDSEIYDRLPRVSRAALYVHEAIYALARDSVGDKSSVRTRKLTAFLMAKTQNADVIAALMEQIVEAPGQRRKWRAAFYKIAEGYYKSAGEPCDFSILKDDASGDVYLTWEGTSCEKRGRYLRMTCDGYSCWYTFDGGRQYRRIVPKTFGAVNYFSRIANEERRNVLYQL